MSSSGTGGGKSARCRLVRTYSRVARYCRWLVIRIDAYPSAHKGPPRRSARRSGYVLKNARDVSPLMCLTMVPRGKSTKSPMMRCACVGINSQAKQRICRSAITAPSRPGACGHIPQPQTPVYCARYGSSHDAMPLALPFSAISSSITHALFLRPRPSVLPTAVGVRYHPTAVGDR